jgi:hypothetical protein
LERDFGGHVYQEKLHLLLGADVFGDPEGSAEPVPALRDLWVLLDSDKV